MSDNFDHPQREGIESRDESDFYSNLEGENAPIAEEASDLLAIAANPDEYKSFYRTVIITRDPQESIEYMRNIVKSPFVEKGRQAGMIAKYNLPPKVISDIRGTAHKITQFLNKFKEIQPTLELVINSVYNAQRTGIDVFKLSGILDRFLAENLHCFNIKDLVKLSQILKTQIAKSDGEYTYIRRIDYLIEGYKIGLEQDPEP